MNLPSLHTAEICSFESLGPGQKAYLIVCGIGAKWQKRASDRRQFGCASADGDTEQQRIPSEWSQRGPPRSDGVSCLYRNFVSDRLPVRTKNSAFMVVLTPLLR